MALVCISGVKECCGCMRCKEEETATCPICGEEEPDYYYRNADGDYIGCSECVEKVCEMPV